MQNFAHILNTVTVDCKDDGTKWLNPTRIDAIKSLLDGSDYHLLIEEDLSLIYGKKPLGGDDIVLVSSHIDCVYSTCYCEEVGDLYRGTFDNSLTNAAVISNMLNGRFADNVFIAFTGDEELDSHGCIEVMNRLEALATEPRFVVVTDVTNEGWDEEAAFSIENDKCIDLFSAHRLVTMLEGNNQDTFVHIHHAEPDESWDYASRDYPVLSLCIPVLGDMHDDFGVVARRRDVQPYCDTLAAIANLM